MDRQEYSQLLEIYGADARRWPTEHQPAAQHWMTRLPELAAEEKQLDTLLDDYVTVELHPDFLNQLVAQAKKTAASSLLVFIQRRKFPVGAMAAACALFGFTLGMLTIPAARTQAQLTQATSTNATDAPIEKIIFGATQPNEVLL